MNTAGMRSTLSFESAMSSFRAEHGHKVRHDYHEIEAELLETMRSEAIQDRARIEAFGEPCGQGGTKVLQGHLRFLTWMDNRRHTPTASDIRARFGVSRATAYRRLAAWKAIRGLA